MICRISEENTWDGARTKLVCRGRRLVREAQAAKDAQVIVGGGSAEKKLMWCHGAGGAARLDVDQIGRSGQSLEPKLRGSRCVQEHGTHAVVQSAQGTLGLAILCRCVWAGEAKGHPMSLKKSAHGVVIKFAAVVSLQSDNR